MTTPAAPEWINSRYGGVTLTIAPWMVLEVSWAGGGYEWRGPNVRGQVKHPSMDDAKRVAEAWARKEIARAAKVIEARVVRLAEEG